MDILDFLNKYWLPLTGITGAIIFVIVYGTKLSNKVDNLGTELVEHTKVDDKMFTELKDQLHNDKVEVKELIDRNKDTTEKASKDLQNQLIELGKDMAIVKNQLNLIISNKIKLG